MRCLGLTILAGLVFVACAVTAPKGPVVVDDPPQWADRGRLEQGWEWSTRAADNTVLFAHSYGTLREFDVPDKAQVLMCATWKRQRRLYFLVGALDADRRFSLLR